MKQLVVGVVGAGRIGKLHINNIKDFPNVRVKIVADPFADKLQDWFETSGVEKLVSDYNEIFEDEEVNVLFICSPTDTHLELIEKGVEHNMHVFCEKPISFSQEETRRVYDVVKNSNSKVQIGFNRRFDANFSKVKDYINDGSIGETQLIKISSRDPEAPPMEYVERSGGLFFDMMIHDFDMARFLGGDIEEVYAQGAALINPEITKYEDIDTAIVTLKFKNGAHGVIDNSRQAVYGYDQRAEAFGTKGQAVADNNTDTRVKLFTADLVKEDNPKYFFLERYNEAFIKETKQFFDAISNNQEVSPSFEDGMKAQDLAFAAKKSLESNQPVRLDN